MPRLGLSQRLWRFVAPQVLHLILHRQEGLTLAGELPQLCSDLVGGARQLGMALGSLFAAGRNEFRAIGRIGVDQLLLLRDLTLIGRDQLFLLELGADPL